MAGQDIPVVAWAKLAALPPDTKDVAVITEGLTATTDVLTGVKQFRWSLIRQAREAGMTFDRIGEALGTSRQRAQQLLAEGFDQQLADKVQRAVQSRRH